MNQLLTTEMLPEGFEYPREFIRVLEQGLTNPTTWHILSGERLHFMRIGLIERYPGRNLVPFACRQDNDDLACWEGSNVSEVRIIHDFAAPGWEEMEPPCAFWDWFRSAIEEMITVEP